MTVERGNKSILKDFVSLGEGKEENGELSISIGQIFGVFFNTITTVAKYVCNNNIGEGKEIIYKMKKYGRTQKLTRKRENNGNFIKPEESAK